MNSESASENRELFEIERQPGEFMELASLPNLARRIAAIRLARDVSRILRNGSDAPSSALQDGVPLFFREEMTHAHRKAWTALCAPGICDRLQELPFPFPTEQEVCREAGKWAEDMAERLTAVAKLLAQVKADASGKEGSQ